MQKEFNIKRVILTGATGAIGMALIEELLQNNVEVAVITREDSSRNNRLRQFKDILVIEASLENLLTAGEKLKGTWDILYHFAWMGTSGIERNNVYLQNRNVTYTLDAVKLAKKTGCKRFVGAGSQAEYGRCNGLLRSDSPVNPESGYGIAKLCAGQMSRILCEQLNLDSLWIRILSIYGPYDNENSMIPYALNKMVRGEKMLLTAGEQIWDYLYSEDAAKAMFLAGSKGKSGKTYILGSGKGRRLKEYIEDMVDVVTEELENHGLNIKPNLGIGEISYAPNQVMFLCGDITELKKDTGFEAEVEFKEGIRRICRTLNY